MRRAIADYNIDKSDALLPCYLVDKRTAFKDLRPTSVDDHLCLWVRFSDSAKCRRQKQSVAEAAVCANRNGGRLISKRLRCKVAMMSVGCVRVVRRGVHRIAVRHS